MFYALLTVNSLIMITAPLLLGILIYRRWGAPWRLYLLGAGTFVAAQVFHLPFNQFVLNPFVRGLAADSAELTFTVPQALLSGLLLGLSAGVFEEVARYIMFRFGAQDARTWPTGLMLGAGHGGIEAVILGLLAGAGVFNIYLIQTGAAEQLATQSPEVLAVAREQIAELIAGPKIMLVAGALERIFALTFHMSASLLVMQAFVRRNIGWLALAILWHTILDAPLGAGALLGWSELQLGLWVGSMALVSLGIILWFRRNEAGAETYSEGEVVERGGM